MILSASKEFIFIHLEKCGGTSVESALEPYLAWYDMIIGSTEFGEELQGLYTKRFGTETLRKEMLWKHSTAHDIHAFVGPDQWDLFKKFSIVRDPVQLVISLYNFSKTVVKYHAGRINRTLWKDKLIVKDYPDAFPYTEEYFIEYVKSVVDDSGINGFVDSILQNNYTFIQPQINRISVPGIKDIGKVVDLSQLNSQWENVVDYLGFEQSIPLIRLNESEKYEADISPGSIKKIKKHFAIDYQELPRYTGIAW